jgi:gamma-glutamyltranspeptidase / glutathione hydrolase
MRHVSKKVFERGIVACVLCLAVFHAGSAVAQQPADRARPTKARGESLDQWSADGSRGIVVAGGAEAVDAGLGLLKHKGNAADAAAATILALTVTDAHQFCFGGEVPIMVYDPKRQVVEVLCGQGVAPKLATCEFFQKEGGIPATGIEPAAVPAALDACLTLLDRFGTKTFAEIVQPTLAILDRHEHAWHPHLARTIRRLIEAERGSPHDRRRGLRLAADYFYRGPIAREIDAWSRANGGLLRFSDLATHVTRVEEPFTAGYRGYTVYKCGPWTQGPYLLQTLQLLAGFDLKSLPHNGPEAVHLSVEALKLGLADRDTYFADPLFEEVPLRELLSPQYADLRRDLIDRSHASLVQRPGDARQGKARLEVGENRPGAALFSWDRLFSLSVFPSGSEIALNTDRLKSLFYEEVIEGSGKDTTTCLAADGNGMLVAATPSGWSGVLAGETGVWLGTRLQSFNAWEGHPNCIAPGKRPRITLTPTLVLKNGEPAIAVSVAGGDGQDQVALQMLVNVIDYGLTPADAVTKPRFWTKHFTSSFRQVPPELGNVQVNPDIGAETIAGLKQRGHAVVEQKGAIWHPTVITRDPHSKQWHAAGDPKAARHAAGF